MRRRRGLIAVLLAACCLAAWHRDTGGAVRHPVLPIVAPAAAAGDRVIVEPDDGMSGIDDLLASPRRSLDLTMYELSDPTAESLLAADAARGVRVRVILDGRLEQARNSPAYEFLRSRGVLVEWSSGRFFATHEKAFVVDGAIAVVMSLNLTSQYYATTRDVAVVDRDPADVAAIESVFAADLRGGGSATPAADDLVWSPGQSSADLLSLISHARVSVALESEELSSPSVVDALTGAAKRGVRVTVAMTYADDWRPAFERLRAAGVQIHVMYGERPLYLHAKLFAIDAGTPHRVAFVGSENLTDASLLHDRELGLVLLDPTSVGRIATVIATDFAMSADWTG
ncbi:MAG TPA: phospholipase D-like domain-containing protein [Mycobacteriales bacterium]|nr:phospholipase D-like domain-containing protein [Mycobacteriales bacterium]